MLLPISDILQPCAHGVVRLLHSFKDSAVRSRIGRVEDYRLLHRLDVTFDIVLMLVLIVKKGRVTTIVSKSKQDRSEGWKVDGTITEHMMMHHDLHCTGQAQYKARYGWS